MVPNAFDLIPQSVMIYFVQENDWKICLITEISEDLCATADFLLQSFDNKKSSSPSKLDL